ncbi:uncharacterized protein LOC133478288 isoform X2 [Phyllopteryx taeniolatus]|uniref:uncharacterized protein LOC133478288 isoform X2 n=1 Tax=Phyllopteryx taeniolatus TaxID=161469 RepID=UPI002AD20942|nr:uncharacterized protein LOC133478288 isoform X2 [Phyllopteryx taeniolatus]XP_061630163.1 uncharacterized protein LOC133478288 isoform X2 [Phyllopteryx taeniolatus]XP_061630164.1 uncharacterized protein LOC133478288 isoform X2 [Phyllopteryx taeniolatus]
MEIGRRMRHRALGGRASVTSQTKLGRFRLSPEERQRRLREGRCFYCGQLGHSVSNCHVKVAGAGNKGTGAVSLNIIKEDPTQVLPKVTLCSPHQEIHTSAFIESDPDLAQVPTCYHDIKEVLSKSKAKSLSPHRPYDCAVDLLPRGRLFSLSRPEHKVMKDYEEESLAAGIIRPSLSLAGAGFFFVDKKDKTLPPCIDYRDLNEITVKNRIHSTSCRRTWERGRQMLLRQGRSYKTAADRRRTPAPDYKVGQRVWLSTKHIPLRAESRKLGPRFVGPFPITKVINPVTMNLRLSRSMRVLHFTSACSSPPGSPLWSRLPDPLLTPVSWMGAMSSW